MEYNVSQNDWPSVIAHRGASGYAPENTLAAFTEAHRRGANWVEFDVKLSKDNILIVFHDDDLVRTTNGYGLVADHTCKEIQSLDAGSWYSKTFANARVPTFEAVLHCLAEYSVGANIEIKPNLDQAEATTLTILESIKQNWPSSSPAPLLSSFELDCLHIARKHDSDIALGLLLDKWRDDWFILAEQIVCVSVHLHYEQITPERVQMIHDRGYKVMVYTVNKSDLAKQLWQWGVDTLFSDYPDRMLALR